MGANISGGHFNTAANVVNQMANFSGTVNGGAYGPGNPGTIVGNRKWSANGTGFLGFEFKIGANPEQYGWARVTMSGGYKHEMKIVDYAYGTPGQAIAAGQTVPVPEPATLGMFAAGALGLLAIRGSQRRKRATEL